MKLITYLDNRFQEVQMKSAVPNATFSLVRDADANACQFIIWGLRFVMKMALTPVVLFGWLLVLTHIKYPPGPALAEAMAAEVRKKEKKARKLGMVQK